MNHTTTIPWHDMMWISHQLFGLSPDIFWLMTMPEWKVLMTSALYHHTSCDDDELTSLMTQFPDHTEEE